MCLRDLCDLCGLRDLRDHLLNGTASKEASRLSKVEKTQLFPFTNFCDYSFHIYATEAFFFLFLFFFFFSCRIGVPQGAITLLGTLSSKSIKKKKKFMT